MLKACRDNNVGRLVYSSSGSVYGDAVEEPKTVDHPFNNKNLCGAKKIAGEALPRRSITDMGFQLSGCAVPNSRV